MIWTQLRELPADFREAIKDPRCKPLGRMVFELIVFGLAKREVPVRYLRNLYYRRGIAKPNRYLGNHQKWRLRHLIVPPTLDVEMLDNKLVFQRHFATADLPLPAYLGHIEQGEFVHLDGDRERIESNQQLARIFTDHVLRDDTVAFVKPLGNYGGTGIIRIEDVADLAPHYAALTGGESFILQKQVAQHRSLSEIYPHAMNTLRVLTCRKGDGSIEAVAARMRFGVGGMFVDNGTSGGFAARVDLGTGRISGPGMRKLIDGGAVYDRHPDTGVLLLGRDVPFFAEAIDLLLRAAVTVPCRLVGWDVGFSPDGPVLIEGNHNPDYYQDEMVGEPLLSIPAIQDMVRDLKRLRRAENKAQETWTDQEPGSPDPIPSR